MYKIIGGDQREYGPIPVEQLREWFKEGRVNAQTQAQAEGSNDWKPLGDLPEFADLLGGVAAPVPAPPVVPAVQPNAEALAAEVLARDYNIDIGSCIRRGWELVKGNIPLAVGGSALVWLAMGVAGAIYVGSIIAGVLVGGLFWLFLKLIRGQPTTIADSFAGFSMAFVPLLLGGLVSGLLECLGFLLCVLPGIYLSVAWVFAVPLIIDKQMDFWAAMECSRKVVHRHWWKMFGFILVCGLLACAGMIACIVGVFFTGAMAMAALSYAYEDIFGASNAKTS